MSAPPPLAFSTLGCPAWTIEEILAAAVRWGFAAIELRGYRDQIDVTQAAPFSPAEREATRRRFAEAGIAFCCLGSSARVAADDREHLTACCELAAALGCPWVRVFGGPRVPESAERLHGFGQIALSAGVQLVLETHDDFSTGASVAALLAEADHPAVFALWDLHHPFHQGEAPATTDAAIGGRTRHVHVKDSRAGQYVPQGDGDLPAEAMVALLRTRGYAGALSLEWEKRWQPQIADPEVAFPRFAEAARAWLAR